MTELPRAKDGRVLWSKVEGFSKWFKYIAAADKTNAELDQAIFEKYAVTLSSKSLEALRKNNGGKQNKSAFQRAVAHKGNTVKRTADEQIIADLKQSNLSLLKKLGNAQTKRIELVNAVYQAAKDSAGAVALPALPKPMKDKRKKTAEVAIAVLSDWQLAKRTSTYNSQICAERIERYGEKVIRLTQIQRAAHPVRELRVYLLGDLVEGELIFEGQAHRIDASLYRQVMLDGPQILGNFLRKMLSVFDKVHVVGVIGNHGALGGGPFRKAYHPESNADAMMMETTRLILQNETRLTWAPTFVPGERLWYAVDYVGKAGFLLFHGDQVKGGFGGFPWYGFGKKIMGWRSGAIPEPFNYALAGHFHTPTRMLIGQVTLWVSGSTESDNTFAAEMLAAQGTPSQWLLFVRPDRGMVTAEYQVHLGNKPHEVYVA